MIVGVLFEMAEFSHSRILFKNKDGTPIDFYFAPCPERHRLKPYIEFGGGKVSNKYSNKEGIIKLTAPGTTVSSDDFIKSVYILDCVERNKLIDIEKYRLVAGETYPSDTEDSFDIDQTNTKSGIIMAQAKDKQGRKKYLMSEDIAILRYLLREHLYNEVSGNGVWKTMELLKITSHTWQSMRDRYLKTIKPRLKQYNLTSQEISMLSGEIPDLVSNSKKRTSADSSFSSDSSQDLMQDENIDDLDMEIMKAAIPSKSSVTDIGIASTSNAVEKSALNRKLTPSKLNTQSGKVNNSTGLNDQSTSKQSHKYYSSESLESSSPVRASSSPVKRITRKTFQGNSKEIPQNSTRKSKRLFNSTSNPDFKNNNPESENMDHSKTCDSSDSNSDPDIFAVSPGRSKRNVNKTMTPAPSVPEVISPIMKRKKMKMLEIPENAELSSPQKSRSTSGTSSDSSILSFPVGFRVEQHGNGDGPHCSTMLHENPQASSDREEHYEKVLRAVVLIENWLGLTRKEMVHVLHSLNGDIDNAVYYLLHGHPPEGCAIWDAEADELLSNTRSHNQLLEKYTADQLRQRQAFLDLSS